jgi:hypothetical protein
MVPNMPWWNRKHTDYEHIKVHVFEQKMLFFTQKTGFRDADSTWLKNTDFVRVYYPTCLCLKLIIAIHIYVD